jgi:hypothetical protein
MPKIRQFAAETRCFATKVAGRAVQQHKHTQIIHCSTVILNAVTQCLAPQMRLLMHADAFTGQPKAAAATNCTTQNALHMYYSTLQTWYCSGTQVLLLRNACHHYASVLRATGCLQYGTLLSCCVCWCCPEQLQQHAPWVLLGSTPAAKQPCAAGRGGSGVDLCLVLCQERRTCSMHQHSTQTQLTVRPRAAAAAASSQLRLACTWGLSRAAQCCLSQGSTQGCGECHPCWQLYALLGSCKHLQPVGR